MLAVIAFIATLAAKDIQKYEAFQIDFLKFKWEATNLRVR